MDRKVKLGMLAGAAIVVGIAALGMKLYRDRLMVSLPDHPPLTKRAVWLEQNWTDKQRQWFHHTDQGTQTLNMPYEWFIALEQPRLALVGDVGRLSDPAYLDRYGFIPGATVGGENQLPVGFARGEIMLAPDGKPWLNPKTRQPMQSLGFTCAACHTGRLSFEGTPILVDGGPAQTDLGKFRQGLGIAVLFTKYVPGRFDRFARNVLGEDANEDAKAELRSQLDNLWERINVIRKLDKQVAEASIEEGYGRLDALNRIGNQVFGIAQGEEGRNRNYAPTSAPVAFPHIWNTSWFDWVQYNASIQQPMVRNAGEALGVSAPVNLADPRQGLFESRVQIENLANMEKQIAGDQPGAMNGFAVEPGAPPRTDDSTRPQGLKSPRWPEGLLGPIKAERAAEGARLYDGLCRGCHLPPVDTPAFWEAKQWHTTPFGQRHLHVAPIDIAMIGTDAAQAEDMAKRKVWTPPHLEIKNEAFGPALGELVGKAVERAYDTRGLSREERDAWNGFRPNGIQALRAYKVRPLNGVWATPPFLHNGSVPNVYALLSPVSERPTRFYLGRREFDPICLGYQLTATPPPASEANLRCLGDQANPDASRLDGGFLFDTAVRGNRNTGHEFNGDGKSIGNGIIGRRLEPSERLAIIEFLKTQ